eukprot:660095-Pelagomonas_calceolata.AAC.3
MKKHGIPTLPFLIEGGNVSLPMYPSFFQPCYSRPEKLRSCHGDTSAFWRQPRSCFSSSLVLALIPSLENFPPCSCTHALHQLTGMRRSA